MGQDYLDFLGDTPDDYVDPSSAPRVLAPKARATSPDGLTYLDDGSPTPLYFMRQQGLQARPGAPALTYTDPANAWLTSAAAGRVDINGNRVEQKDPRKLLAATGGGVPETGIPLGGDLFGTLDPVRAQRAGETPLFSVSAAPRQNMGDPNFSAAGVPLRLSAGDPAQVPGARYGTQPEADAGNARYEAWGSSNPTNGDFLQRPPQAQGIPGGAGSINGSGGLPPAGPGTRGNYRTDDVNAQIQGFLASETSRKGPSEAEALLNKTTDRNQAMALGIAAGARGGAGARERARTVAQTTNAALGAQATQDVAILRAKEDVARKDRLNAIYSLLGQGAAQGDLRDLGYTESANNLTASKYNVDAATVRADADREFSRDKFNAEQPVGLEDDPLAWLVGRLPGNPSLRGGKQI